MGTATHSDGQLKRSAAEIYDSFFVPALFGEWAPRLADAIRAQPGQSLLDVACGTGVLTRELHARAVSGRVVGLDRNPGMLAVARTKYPHIDWREARAERLPFDAETFDGITCQFGLMFFDDRTEALEEMKRVLRPGGRLSIAVWGELSMTPGYDAMVSLLDTQFGARVADELRAPFCLGALDRLRALLDKAGLLNAQIETVVGTARFRSLDAWLTTDVRGWTLADLIDDVQFERLRESAAQHLDEFVLPDGSVSFPSPAHIITVEAARGSSQRLQKPKTDGPPRA